jgi:hypothetical protein
MEKFFCILLIHKNSKRGYVYETLKGEIDSSPKFIDECKKFTSVDEAKQYARENKLQNGHWTVHIRDEKDIAKEREKDKREGQGYSRIVNELGQSAFYDQKKKQYYWKASEAGCTAWENEDSANSFIKKMKIYFPTMKFSAKPLGG